MARLPGSRAKSAPKYRLHKPSQNAVVTINGKNIYLGRYDTPESHELYRRLIAEQWGKADAPKPIKSKPRGVKKLKRSLWAMKNELGHHFENENSVEIASTVRLRWSKLKTNSAWAQRLPAYYLELAG